MAQAREHCANTADVLHLRYIAPLASKLSDQCVEALQALRNLDTVTHASIPTIDVVTEIRSHG